jgi:hypothetical protein
MVSSIHQYSGLPCPSCGIPSHFEDAAFDGFFRGSSWICLACDMHGSLWTMLLDSLRSDNQLAPGAVAIGAATSAFGQIVLEREHGTGLNLAELGVPPEANVLGVYLTPIGSEQGVLFPAMTVQSLTRKPVSHELFFFGHPIQGGAESTRVGVMCTWFNPTEPEAEPLMTALQAYSEGSYRQAIVPASVAVEAKLGSVLRDYFQQFAGKEKVESFLSTGATFGFQLSPLLPALMAGVGAPPLTEHLAGQLNRLKTLRNKVAHEHVEVSKNDASEVVLAALFGFHYLRLYGKLLRVPHIAD